LPGDLRYHPSCFGKTGQSRKLQMKEVSKRDSSSFEEEADNDDDGNKTSYNQNSSYMGVFKLKKDGSHYRRIDFKSYPTKCYPFALLSFTGSGNFNRSLRFFVDKIGGHLSDNSLRLGVSRDPRTHAYIKSGSLIRNLKTERDIFDFLELDYYEPHERNYFLRDTDLLKIKDREKWKKTNLVNEVACDVPCDVPCDVDDDLDDDVHYDVDDDVHYDLDYDLVDDDI